MENTPRSAAIYCRISYDKTGAGLGVARQERECRELAARLGWTVVEVFTDNDISAYSGKPRPGYRRMLAAITDGRVNAVLAWHTDRLHRSPVELEEYISACTGHGRVVPTHCVTAGEMDLSTPSGRMMARQFGNMARYESEHRAERVRAAVIERAQDGRRPGGPRPFGYHYDGLTKKPTVEQLRDWHVKAHERHVKINKQLGDDAHPVPPMPDTAALKAEAKRIADEPKLIRKGTKAALDGNSLKSIADMFNKAGSVTTLKGRPWTRTAVREVLLRPRNAGLVELNGETVGDARWEKIVDVDDWRAVVVRLTAADRRTSPPDVGRRRWFGSGLYRCGGCGGPMHVSTSGKRASARYRCAAGKAALPEGATSHVTRTVAPLDEYVQQLIIERLSRPDATELLIPPEEDPEVDVVALRVEAKAAADRLDEIADMLGDGELTRAQAKTATEKAKARRDRAEAALDAATGDAAAPLRGLADADDPAEAWEGLDLGRRRAVLDALMTVTVHSAGFRAGPIFDPSTVQVDWRAGSR